MAIMLTMKDLCVEYPTKRVLDRVTLGVFSGDRIGIVGDNGQGKSTLLRVAAGLTRPDEGQVIRKGSPTVGMLAQSDEMDDESIVADHLLSTDGIPWEADRSRREIVEALLGGMNPGEQVGALSGGQRRRLDLCRLLMGNWDLLLLDEPTNHLDISAINWLAHHLRHRWMKGSGALLVVTHDRWFLDEVCSHMWELHDGNVDAYEGAYSAYVLARVERARLAEQTRRKRENQLRKELAWLSRGAQARRSKPKFHLEQAAALIANEPEPRKTVELKKAATTRLGKQVLELEGACVDVGGKRLVDCLDWTVGPGQRIGLLGGNGAGKTSLLRVLMGEIPLSAGRLRVGKTVKMALLSQGLEELAPVENDVVRVVCARYKTSYEVDGKLYSPSSLLERLGFTSNELNARCKELSGGQRRRLQLMLTLLEEPNVLLLDEPGNDLDTDMMAAMEDLLDSWPGTLIVVSHDRHLIERTTDDLYALADGKLRHLPGGVDEYLSLARTTNPALLISETEEHDCSHKPSQGPTNAEIHALKKKLASLERRIASQQARVDEAQGKLDAADPYDAGQLFAAQTDLDAQRSLLAQLEEEWFEVGLALQ